MITSQIVQLKNGKEVVIRPCKLSDVEKLRGIISTYINDSAYIPKFQDELNWQVKDTKEWIESFRSKENSLLLVAEYNNELIGNIDLTGHTRKAMQHTCVIGMGMLLEWRNTGLGTALLEHAIHWAKRNSIVELLWLQVYTENKAGIGLYRKMGFIENGILRHFFKHKEKYFDQLTMSKSVK